MVNVKVQNMYFSDQYAVRIVLTDDKVNLVVVNQQKVIYLFNSWYATYANTMFCKISDSCW